MLGSWEDRSAQDYLYWKQLYKDVEEKTENEEKNQYRLYLFNFAPIR